MRHMSIPAVRLGVWMGFIALLELIPSLAR
jgi:hypothetical protein